MSDCDRTHHRVPSRLKACPELPERIATNPITLVCPRCHAGAGQVCDVVAGEFEVVHMERIVAAAAETVGARHRTPRSW
jgi:hypothetical protein